MVHPWPYEIMAMSQNVILITGAAGFLGSAITVALLPFAIDLWLGRHVQGNGIDKQKWINTDEIVS